MKNADQPTDLPPDELTPEQVDAIKRCKYADTLNAIHKKIKTNRDYWLFTEVFVLLHDGSDECNCT